MKTSAFIKFKCLVLAFTGLASGIQAQDITPDKLPVRHIISINGSGLFNRIIRQPGDTTNQNPYLLGYRISRGRYGLRVGAGGARQYTETRQAGFRDVKTTNNTNVDLRLGLDMEINVGRGFRAFFGVDGLRQWKKHETVDDSGFDVIRTIAQSEAYGGGPFAGLMWQITPWLGLYTETGFYYLTGKSESGRTFSNFPELNDEVNQQQTQEFQAILPASIFVTFRF